MAVKGQEGQDVANVTESDEPARYLGEGWDTFEHEIGGADFTKGDVMVGVPFGLTRITIRPGDYMHEACKRAHPYMYMEAVIAPEHEIQKAVARQRITEEQAKLIDPGEMLGWNEAGTGVYRQILAYLESQGYITLPEGPADGHFGESRFDSHPDTWQFHKGEYRVTDSGEPVYVANVRLRFPRGLRLSEYQNEYTKEGRTRYAA